MITFATAELFVNRIGSAPSQTGAPGEYFPDMVPPAPLARRNRFRSGWSAVIAAPSFVIRLAARLVPAPIKAELTARAEARALATNIRRLADISPHLLADIGIKQVAADVYEMMATDEALADARSPEPAVTALQPEPAAPAARAAPQRVRQPSAKRAPVAPAGGVLA